MADFLGGLVDAGVGAIGSAVDFGFGQWANSLNSARAWRYYKKQKKFDYSMAANEYYNLAQRYAENTASWQTRGLRKAGLNPILAASSGSFSSPTELMSSGGSMDLSQSGYSGRTDINEARRDSASARQLKAQADIAEKTANKQNELIDAQIKEIESRIKANNAKAKRDSGNKDTLVRSVIDKVKSPDLGERIHNFFHSSSDNSATNAFRYSTAFNGDVVINHQNNGMASRIAVNSLDLDKAKFILKNIDSARDSFRIIYPGVGPVDIPMREFDAFMTGNRSARGADKWLLKMIKKYKK